MTVGAALQQQHNQKPKICVYTRAWRTSGAGLFAQDLVEGLVKVGARVTFVSPRIDSPFLEAPHADLRRLRPPRERSDNAAAPLLAARSLARIVGGALALLRARFSNRVFVFTIPDPLPFTVPLMFLLRMTGARLVFVAHDPVPHAWRLPKNWRRLEHGAHGACYRLASHVVALSEPTRLKLLESYPGLKTPIDVIEHGEFDMGEPVAPAGTGQLLVFGTIRRNKGVLESIAGVIAARHAGVPVKLIVAGEAHREDPSYTDLCHALANTAPDLVEMRVGYVDEAALPHLVAASDALLMPYSSFFSQSGVAILAASNARPIIASAAGGIGTLLAEGMPSVLIGEPITAGSVAEAVHSFFETPIALWYEKALAYRRSTMERRSWTAIATRYVALSKALGA